MCKKSDLHLISPRFIVALGIFVCYTLKIEGSEESALNGKLLREKIMETESILFFDTEVTSDGSKLLDIGAVKDDKTELHTTNRGMFTSLSLIHI